MRPMKKLFPLFVVLSISGLLQTNGQIPNNTWRDHIAYTKSHSIAYAGSRVYCAANGGLFFYDKDDHTINKFSRVHGLSDVDLSKIAYDDQYKTLIIAYQNGNIDLFVNNTIHNLPDIERSFIIGSKTINAIEIKDGLAYLATGFGIVVMDIDRKEFKDTYLFGPGGSNMMVNDIEIIDNILYASTDEGIYTADLNNPLLVNYENWQRMMNLPVPTGRYTFMDADGDALYVVHADEVDDYVVYVVRQNQFTLWEGDMEARVYGLAVKNNIGYLSVYGYVRAYNNATGEDKIYWGSLPREIEIVDDSEFYFADYMLGMVAFVDKSRHIYTPDGPFTDQVFSVRVYNDVLYTTRGGATVGLNNSWITAGYNYLKEEKWFSKNVYTANDFSDVAVDPRDPGHVFVSSWGHGLYEFQDDVLVDSFNFKNTQAHPLRSIIPGSAYMRIGTIRFDQKGNLWVVNSGVEHSVHAFTPEREWISFNYGEEMNNHHQTDMIITQSGVKWVIMPTGGGLFVFDNGNDLEDRSDDRTKRLSVVDEDGIPLNDVFSIAEDKDGDIWVGTSQGPVVYYTPERVFDENLIARYIMVPKNDEDNTVGKLLESSTITDIEIDGANRKWLSTAGSGVFLMSEDGTRELKHFTTDNSPLLSNDINDVVVHPRTGEVFIATTKGLISYMGEATEGDDLFRNVYVYPNPVRPGYTGDITVTGLIADANVKITDISGNIVYETTTIGGQAIWNGRNLNGKKVHTGVYLVFCTNNDGSKTHVTKLLFVR
ncbi:MAG: two-component regulator propeller domain-containing protein [Bacteroidota bacterium]